ncbi:bacillithiol system protein YtxJ [compost metagenome]
MNWIPLIHTSQLDTIKQDRQPSLIFKHSTRCSVSAMAKRRFEQEWDCLPAILNLYFLDLLSYRTLSSAVADQFEVHHESPQLLLIKEGECILDASHGDISASEVAEVLIRLTS